MNVEPIPKPEKPIKDKRYLKWLTARPCLYCGGYAGQAHHVRSAGDCGMGTKVHDYLTIPLCLVHHDLAHNNPVLFGRTVGREEVFGSILNNLMGYAEDAGWDISEILELLVGAFIEWIAKERK